MFSSVPSLPSPSLIIYKIASPFLSFSTYNYFPVVCLTPLNNFTSSQPHTIFFYKVLRAPKSILFEEIFLYMLSLYFLVLFTFLFYAAVVLRVKVSLQIRIPLKTLAPFRFLTCAQCICPEQCIIWICELTL